jgi:3-hydroxyisobutyrate dehydrogenase-like beta-hydroxyacid dehydrogenase
MQTPNVRLDSGLAPSARPGMTAVAKNEGAGMKQTVGVIGLGLMGEVLATRLMAAGFDVLGYDVDPAKNAKLAALGGKAAASPAGVAACSVIALAVFNTDQVEEVTEQALLPDVKPGTVVLCTSTCDPDRIEALGKRLAGSSIRFLETPVSGTSEQVRAGDGVGLIGGDPNTADDVKPVLDALFPRRYHIGKAGDGGRAKLAVNLILGLNRMALAEGLTFAERMGLDPKAFLAVAQGSASQSQVMGTKGPKMLARDFAPEGRVKQTLKDVHMMLDQAEQLGQELPMLRVHCDVLEACVRAGEAERDNSIIVEEIRRRRRP